LMSSGAKAALRDTRLASCAITFAFVMSTVMLMFYTPANLNPVKNVLLGNRLQA